MKILALETSAKSVSAAVTENGAVLASAYQNRGLTHSVTLMPLIDGMLRTAGLSLDDIGLIAAANGTGQLHGAAYRRIGGQGLGVGQRAALLRRVHAGGYGADGCGLSRTHHWSHGRPPSADLPRSVPR